MKALSIRQPWAWAIVHAGKTIENRNWQTKYRGEILIHASKRPPYRQYFNASKQIEKIIGLDAARRIPNPRSDEAEYGGVIGVAELVAVVDSDTSPWFFGEYGFVLDNIRPVRLYPTNGQLGIFDIPVSVDELMQSDSKPTPEPETAKTIGDLRRAKRMILIKCSYCRRELPRDPRTTPMDFDTPIEKMSAWLRCGCGSRSITARPAPIMLSAP